MSTASEIDLIPHFSIRRLIQIGVGADASKPEILRMKTIDSADGSSTLI
jgi:hypothetical protein